MNNAEFLKKYRQNKSAIWLKVKLTDGKEIYSDDPKAWKSVKAVCDAKKIFLEEFSLQFRSHEVKIDVKDTEGVYFVRSILGQMGADSKHYFTVGILKDNKVHKKMWLVPELVSEKEYADEIEDCFSEALIYNGANQSDDKEKKENRKK